MLKLDLMYGCLVGNNVARALYIGVPGTLLVTFFVGLISVGASGVALSLAGLAVVAATIWRPIFAVHCVLIVNGFALMYPLLGIDSGSVHGLASLIVLLGLLSIAIRKELWRSLPAVALIALVVLVCTVTVVIGAYSIDLGQSLQGIRLWVLPIAAALIARFSPSHQAASVLLAATVIAVLSVVAGVAQLSLGSEALMAMGLEYGSAVRTYEGTLRVPGLFATNYEFGAFAGVLGAAAILWQPSSLSRRYHLWRYFTIAVSCAALLVSWYRTGMVVLFVALIAIVFINARTHRFGRGFLVVLGGFVSFWGLDRAGYTSAESLEIRTTVWGSVLEQYPLRIFGYGLGTAGAASRSRLSSLTIVTDNYYLNLWLQLGPIIATVFIGVLLLIALRMLLRARQHPVMRMGVMILGLLASFAFVEFWEYTAATSLAMSLIGFSFGVVSKENRAGSTGTSMSVHQGVGHRLLM